MTDKYFNFFGLIMNYSILLVMSGSLMFKYSNKFVLYTSLCIYLMMLMVLKYKKTAITLSSIGIGSYIICLIGHLDYEVYESNLSKYIDKLYFYLRGDVVTNYFVDTYLYYINQLQETPYLLDKLVFIMVSMIITSVVLILIEKRRVKTLLIIPPLFFMIQWIRYVDISFIAMKWYIVGFVGMVIYSISKDKNEKLKNQRYFVYSLIISLIILLLTNITFALFPLEKINKKMSSFMPVITSLRTGYSSRSDEYIFEFKGTMYQPESDRLGGKIIDRNYDVLMLVDSDEGGQYLRGSVKDYYTGEKWKSTNTKYKNKIVWNEDDGNKNAMRVYYENIQTATLFTPLYIESINLNKNKVFMNDDEVFYYDRDSFERRMDYFDLEYYNEPISTSKISKLNKYLQLPKDISERLEELAFSLTEDYFSDEEKIQSIKIFLIENYSYTLHVDYVPGNTEFVDYFLFEGKEGYCTYFATAMAIMARINKIPSRYVEGYITSIEKNNQGFYEATADRAHAWVEVYYNGYWHTVESTPYYYDERKDIDMDSELIVDTDSKQVNGLKDEEILEPVVINELDSDMNSIFSVIIVILSVCFSGVVIYNIIVYKKIFNKMTIKDKLKFILYIYEHSEDKDEQYRVPEKVIKNFLNNKFDYTVSRKMTMLLQKLFYSTDLIKEEEKSYIIKEIDLIEDLIIKKIKLTKYVVIKRKFCKQNMFWEEICR